MVPRRRTSRASEPAARAELDGTGLGSDVEPIRAALQSVGARYSFMSVAVVAANLVDGLHPDEEAHARDMNPRRRVEFVAGRSAGRLALLRAGHPDAVIGRSSDGVPQFPLGYVGSISHKHERAVAIVGRSDGALGIGVDLEFDEGHDEAALSVEIFTTAESAALEHLRAGEPSLRSPATLGLAVKEAVYKAVYPITRTEFDFDDVEIFFPGSRSFRAIRFPGDAALVVEGRYELSGRWIVAMALAAGSKTSV